MNPTARTQTLRALDMHALVASDELFPVQYGDSRKEMMERLAGVARTGELPEYMRELVDSVPAHAESPTS